MINAILIDDDARCIKALKDVLTDSNYAIKILAECASADEAIAAISRYKPDLVFLDVEMPGKTGFDLLHDLETIDFDIIFTTAYEQYAIQAIRASALDFLLKPVTLNDVDAALRRYELKKNSAQTIAQVKVLLENYGLPKNANKTIAVPTNNGIEFIRTNQIIRLESDSNYTTFFLHNNTKLVVAKTLKEMEELLPEPLFYRVHHSHLINTSYVKRYQKSDGGMLIMEDKSEVPVSRQRKDELLVFLKHA
jgi:two-component system LytT family response regulator